MTADSEHVAESEAPEDAATPWYRSMRPGVFYPALAVIVVFVLMVVLGGQPVRDVIAALPGVVVSGFGWYYVLLVTGFVAFSVWIGTSHYGDIVLGKANEPAEFRYSSWLAMLFAAGMGIGLMFWGVAEPLHHFAGIPNRSSGVATMNETGAQDSLVTTFLHWGLHPWAIYVVVGLSIAYAIHVRDRPVSIRWSLEALLGKRTDGWIGNTIDVVAIVGTVFGVATSLGLGVAQVAGGLEFMEIISTPSNAVKLLLIGGITLLALISVATGVKKGIKYLSNANMVMAVGLLLFVMIAGPTMFLLREYVEGIGAYLQEFLRMSFATTALAEEAGVEWQSWWTAFYWGWWISWAPFVGIFIARISRGRTVREFVVGVLLVPTAFSFLWFTVLGGTALYRELFGEGGLITEGEDGLVVDETLSLFQMLEGLPGGTVLAGLALLLVVLFFVTSSDSGSLVIDMLASGGNPDPPTWSRLLWGALEGLVAAALVLAGGLVALRGIAITIALPFSVIMIFMCVALVRQFRRQRARTLRIQRRLEREELTGEVSQALVEEGRLLPVEPVQKARRRR
ncbi:BCCT family transporter [Pseudactinotalea suaedae]|uniref:BCCT family transporter n=1 Tax=Pseudactinotalea suaedae TaxID=1524924 RepID=UPI0012E18931|nr:BCCT family transporter [Pseudactinotalea suaedae]